MTPLSIESETQDDWQVLRFSGAVDAGNFALFEEAVFTALDRKPQRLRLDLGNVHSLNSPAIGLLIAAQQEV